VVITTFYLLVSSISSVFRIASSLLSMYLIYPENMTVVDRLKREVGA